MLEKYYFLAFRINQRIIKHLYRYQYILNHQVKKIKLNLIPKTNLGKWSIALIIVFFLLLSLFFLLVNLGERGGATFFSNLKLTIPMLAAGTSAITSFVTGVISIIKKKERSILVILASILGFLVLLYIIAEFSSPH